MRFYGKWGHRLEKWRRITCEKGSWSTEKLKGFEQQLPADYAIKQVSCPAEVKGLIRMGDGLIDFPNYPTPQDFLDRGAGFIVDHNGGIVSGCTSYAVGGGKFDISVTTRREHQRRGLAQAVAARMILHCLQEGIEAVLGCAERSGRGTSARNLGTPAQDLTRHIVFSKSGSTGTARSWIVDDCKCRSDLQVATCVPRRIKRVDSE